MKNTPAILLVALSFSATLTSSLSAAQGDLDLTFGSGGKAIAVPAALGVHNVKLALQADGKVVVAGNAGRCAVMARFTEGGLLDSAFGIGGLKKSQLFQATGYTKSLNSGFYGLALPTDGRPLLVGAVLENGSAKEDCMIGRCKTDGDLDLTFGPGGAIGTSFGHYLQNFLDAAVQADQKIVAVGYAGDGADNAFALARYTNGGVLDTSFGNAGRVINSPGATGYAEALTVAIQTDGRIVAGGFSGTNDAAKFALARYLPSGALDTSFGVGGEVTTSVGNGCAVIKGLALQADGKIIAVGYADTGMGNAFALVRYTASGELDMGFGTNGRVVTSFAGLDDRGDCVALQADGKILVGGWSQLDSYPFVAFAIARYTAVGTLDPTFGNGGKVTTLVGDTNGITSIAVQPDGKIVAAGGSTTSTITIVRYLGEAIASEQVAPTETGTPTPVPVTPGGNGTASLQSLLPLPNPNFGNWNQFVRGISADGNTVVGYVNGGGEFGVFRWTSTEGIALRGGEAGGLVSGGHFSFPYGVSADGSVMVGMGGSYDSPYALAWTSVGGETVLSGAGALVPTAATAISADGSVIVGTGSDHNMSAVFRWTAAGGLQDCNLRNATANAISADGQVFVGARPVPAGQMAYRWTQSGGCQILGDLPGGDVDSVANGVSADGSVVVGSGDSSSQGYGWKEAFRWENGVLAGLGFLPGGAWSEATAVSADGKIVVGESQTGLNEPTAFVWTAPGGMQSLKSLLTQAGVDLTGWKLWYASAITPDGSVIAGSGMHNGNIEGYIAHLPVRWLQPGGNQPPILVDTPPTPGPQPPSATPTPASIPTEVPGATTIPQPTPEPEITPVPEPSPMPAPSPEEAPISSGGVNPVPALPTPIPTPIDGSGGMASQPAGTDTLPSAQAPTVTVAEVSVLKSTLFVKGTARGEVTGVSYRLVRRLPVGTTTASGTIRHDRAGASSRHVAVGETSWTLKVKIPKGRTYVLITAHGPGGDSHPAAVPLRWETRKLQGGGIADRRQPVAGDF